MPNLAKIRTRINALRKTAQITRAMKMVSAVKLRRIQTHMLDSRPYVENALAVMRLIAQMTDPSKLTSGWLATKQSKRILLVAISADRGLCGSLNYNILRKTQGFLKELSDPEMTVDLYLIGRKGIEYFRNHLASYGQRVSLIQTILASDADPGEISRQLETAYRSGSYCRLHLIYTHFESALRYYPAEQSLLPLSLVLGADLKKEASFPPILEPDAEFILNHLAPRYLQASVRHILLTASVAEHSARMGIMEEAHKKAEDIIQEQQLFFNKARQMSIDRELADIIAGIG